MKKIKKTTYVVKKDAPPPPPIRNWVAKHSASINKAKVVPNKTKEYTRKDKHKTPIHKMGVSFCVLSWPGVKLIPKW